MMTATENSGKERFMSVVQRKRQPSCMNGVQKKSQAIFFVNNDNAGMDQKARQALPDPIRGEEKA